MGTIKQKHVSLLILVTLWHGEHPNLRASLFSKRWIALKKGAATALKVGGEVAFRERVMAGCEMLPCGLSQESGGSSAELLSPLCHYKHTLMTKRVIDVHLKVKAGVFLWTHWSLTHAHSLSLAFQAFRPLNHCRHWLKGVRQTWRNKKPGWCFPSLEEQGPCLNAVHPSCQFHQVGINKAPGWKVRSFISLSMKAAGCMGVKEHAGNITRLRDLTLTLRSNAAVQEY